VIFVSLQINLIVMAKKVVNLSLPDGPRDGLDNTGTQGYDSLSDEGREKTD
jgi:hypothetical protein